MHKVLIMLLSRWIIKYIKTYSSCLILSDITILYVSTKFKIIGLLGEWNSFY